MNVEGEVSLRRLRGVIPYLVTPIDDNGRVMTSVIERLSDDLISAGVHGLTPLGSTGEFAYLNESQKACTVEAVVAAARGRVPVLAGVASTASSGAISQARSYKALGVNGIVLTLEAYFPLSAREVESYFRSVADAIDLPIVVYTNPNFQRSDLSIATIERLSTHPNIVGLKDASTNTGRLLSVMNRCGDAIDVFAASSHIPAAVMMLGGRGWFAGPACVVPRQSIKLYELCLQERWSEAIALQKRLWQINELFGRNNLAACIKGALIERGYEVGDPLAPQSPLTSAEQAEVRAVLIQLDEEETV